MISNKICVIRENMFDMLEIIIMLARSCVTMDGILLFRDKTVVFLDTKSLSL